MEPIVKIHLEPSKIQGFVFLYFLSETSVLFEVIDSNHLTVFFVFLGKSWKNQQQQQLLQLHLLLPLLLLLLPLVPMMRWLPRDVASGATRGSVIFGVILLRWHSCWVASYSSVFLLVVGVVLGYHFYGLSNCVQPLQFFENPWVPMDIDLGFQGFGFDSGPNSQPWVVLFVSWAPKTKLAANVGRCLSQTRDEFYIISRGKKTPFQKQTTWISIR